MRLDDPIVAEVVERWRALTDAGRRETPLDQMLEEGLARPIRHGRNFVPGAAEVLQGQLPWLVAHLAALGIDSYAEMSRHLGLAKSVVRQWSNDLGLAPPEAPASEDPVVAGVVERWRALPDAGRFSTPLLRLLEQALEQEGRPVRRGSSNVALPWIMDVVRDQLPWPLLRFSYSDRDLARQLGVGESRAVGWRRELGLVRLVAWPQDPVSADPVVAGVVARWRALPDASRSQTPLLGLLEQALADEGRAVREGRGYAAGVAEVLQRQAAWLLERGGYSGDELAGQLGVHPEVAGVWRRDLKLVRLGAVRLDEPVVAGVVERWRALSAEGRALTPLLGLLEQALAPEGRRVHEGRAYAPGVPEVLQAQLSWLLARGYYNDHQLGRQLGTGHGKPREWREALGLGRRPVGADEPVVAGVVERWQGLTDEGRARTPLVGLLGRSLAREGEGRPVREGRGFVPGVAEVLRQQLAWLWDRGGSAYSDGELARRLGSAEETVGHWRADLALERRVVRAGDPDVAPVLAGWMGLTDAGRRRTPLLDMLAEQVPVRFRGRAEGTSGPRLMPGVAEVLRQQMTWLLDQREVSNHELERQLGVETSIIWRWRMELEGGSSESELTSLADSEEEGRGPGARGGSPAWSDLSSLASSAEGQGGAGGGLPGWGGG